MKHFLSIMDYDEATLSLILDEARSLKDEYRKGGNKPILKGKSLALVFQKPSLRTRVSFEMGMQHLGGYAFYLSPDEIGLGKREAVKDIAQVLGGYASAIMARVFQHQHLVELAEYAGVPIINGLSDYNHPCQAMADALTIIEEFGNMKGINITYIGDGNNVAVSLMDIAVKLGANFSIANPDGYDMPEQAISTAQKAALTSGSRISFYTDPSEAVHDADVIYTDTWISMGQEAQSEERIRTFKPYQVNQQLIDKASSNVIVMHCLPSHRGFEITDEVQDGPHSRVIPQAHNRLHAQKGILAYLLAKE
ncbi:MAG: ornithine carbamoyltransferase [Chloroflexi bacterium]|nr:ornithine carbamoyltransferase [Chloroflexota bacterium]